MKHLSRDRQTLNLAEQVQCLPFCKSRFGCLCLSSFTIISIIPKTGIKPLWWNIYYTVLSLQQNSPEVVQCFT